MTIRYKNLAKRPRRENESVYGVIYCFQSWKLDLSVVEQPKTVLNTFDDKKSWILNHEYAPGISEWKEMNPLRYLTILKAKKFLFFPMKPLLVPKVKILPKKLLSFRIDYKLRCVLLNLID